MSMPEERPKKTETFRVTCPHNCCDACGQIATVEGGVLRSLEGDPLHPHARGRLCAKGYSYADRVYARERLRYPMLQTPRGSGNWRKVTWQEALDRIARSILSLQARYGSLLPVCLYRGTGNLGALSRASEGLFRAMGPVTLAVNTLRSAAGREAQICDFGAVRCSDPTDMARARTILVWGANPAWTAPHQMSLIMEAKDQGASLVVIDPICTATASVASLHVAPRPGSDGALALGMARVLLDEGLTDPEFLRQHVLGFGEFAAYLRQEVEIDWAAAQTGLSPSLIRQLARVYAQQQPSVIWVGRGMLRYRGSRQAVRAIDALAAVTGQIGRPGTGVQFGQSETDLLGHALLSFPPPVAWRGQDRQVLRGPLSLTLPSLTDPPVRMLWITGANPVSQEPDPQRTQAMMRKMETVVVTDQFMTQTAAEADILLPATSYLEQWNLHVSYWHHLASISEQAIEPSFEARSDLSIAWALSHRLNQLYPGLCSFPVGGTEREWIDRCWTAEATQLFGITGPEELRKGAVRARLPQVAWASRQFATPSGRYELRSARAAGQGEPALPVYRPAVNPPKCYPLRLLTPHPAESLNSQFHSPDWIPRLSPQPAVEMHPDTAERFGLGEGDRVRLFNGTGELTACLRTTRTVPSDCVVAYSAVYERICYNVNNLVAPEPGGAGSDIPDGVAFGETFVAVELLG